MSTILAVWCFGSCCAVMVVLCEEGAHDDDKKSQGGLLLAAGASQPLCVVVAVFVCGWLACSAEKGKNHLTLLSLN